MYYVTTNKQCMPAKFHPEQIGQKFSTNHFYGCPEKSFPNVNSHKGE